MTEQEILEKISQTSLRLQSTENRLKALANDALEMGIPILTIRQYMGSMQSRLRLEL